MMRGSILNNGTDFYVLVRAELGEAKNANGTPIAKQARYNLVNLGTGKTRVSDPSRMFLQAADVDEVNLASLKRHFDLPNLVDTGTRMQDINIPQMVQEAVAAKERARLQMLAAQQDPMLALLAQHLAQNVAIGARLW